MEAPDQRPSKPEARPSGEDTARESTTAPESPPYRAFWLAALLILLAAFALRLVALTSLPLSVDEDSHILRAYEVMNGNLYIGFQQQKWLYTVALALFQPSGPESVWLGRVLSILCGGFSAATVITLARLLARRAIGERAGARAGLAAGLIYAVLPMAVFHERQALVDPLMVAFAMFSVLLAMRLARRPRFVTGLLLALALSGAVLTKASALPFLVFPALAALLLAHRRALPGALALSVVAAVAAWLAYQEVADQARQAGIVPRGTHRPHLNNLVTGASTPAQALATFQSNLADIAEGLLIYVGPATLALAALALLWLLWGRARRETLFVAASTALFAATLALSKQVTGHGYLPPRYMLPSTLPIVALAGCALIVYGLVGQSAPPPSVLFPSTVYNADTFARLFGFPIQLLRSAAAAVTMVGLLAALRALELERQRTLRAAIEARLAAQAQAQEEMARREVLQTELLRRTVATQEEERARIARELHDHTGQTLTALAYRAAALEPVLDGTNATAQELVGDLRQLTDQALADLRHLVTDLRPAQLDDLGLVAALHWLADQAHQRLGLEVTVEVAGRRARLPGEAETALFRIAQEAITNAARHAGVKHAQVCLEFAAEAVTLTVSDDGRGFDMAAVREDSRTPESVPWGLIGMEERAHVVGGELRLESAPGQGTTVSVRMPAPGEERDG